MKQNKVEENTSYWKTTSDMLMGLLMVVLLLLLLFILIIMNTQEEHPYNADEMPGAYDYVEPKSGSDMHNASDQMQQDNNQQYPVSGLGAGSGAGAGAGSGHSSTGVDAPGEENEPTPTVIPSEQIETGKAAVYVIVEDGETGFPIHKDGISFSLYSSRDEMQKLHTYYPYYTLYEEYATQADGTFYLPEKIVLGDYYFTDLTAPDGYDLAADTAVTIDRECDWADAFTVHIPVYPSMNYIRLQLNDHSDGQGLSGSSYEVIAAHDIVTADGTTRYKKGEVATVITVDETGYGESSEIVLGEYLLRQQNVAFGYVQWAENPTVVVKKKNGTTPELVQASIEKTTVIVYLKDEYNSNAKLSNAAFELIDSNGKSLTLLSNESGILYVSNLEKDATYTLKQVSSLEHYRYSGVEQTFTVDASGRVDGEAQQILNFQNYVIRINAVVNGFIFPMEQKNCGISLYDENGSFIHKWNGSGMDAPIEIDDSGSYTLEISGVPFQKVVREEITVEDESGIQNFTIRVWTFSDIALIGIAALMLIGGSVALILHTKAKKSEAKL